MDKLLLEILIFMNFLLVVSTTINVMQKLNMISGPAAHIVIALLSQLVIFGYIGVLNTVFLKKKFYKGRILYIATACLCQFIILCLSFLAYINVMSYSLVIVIIYAITGLITMMNFSCAVIVVIEQQREIDNDDLRSQNGKIRRKIAALLQLTRSRPYVEFQMAEMSITQYDSLLQRNQQYFEDEEPKIQ